MKWIAGGIGKTLGLAILTVVLVAPINTLAMSDAQRRIFDLGIPYYNVDGGSTLGGGGNCLGGGLNVTLTPEALAKIQSAGVDAKIAANQAAYEAGAEAAGIPWPMLAAIHYREAGMDPNRSIANGQALGSGVSVDGQPIGDTLEEDAVIAGNKVKAIAASVYGVNLTTSTSSMDDLGNAFLAYNRGYMYKEAGEPYTNSPYVMNYFDAAHAAMTWIHADSFFRGVQYNSLEGSTDGNVGALTIYAYITGENLSSSDCPSQNMDAATVKQAFIDTIGISYSYTLTRGPQAGITYTANPYGASGNGCTSLSAWFIDAMTDLNYNGGNGGDVVANLVNQSVNPGLQMEPSDRPPRAPAIFSSRSSNYGANPSTMCGGIVCGHTGIIVAVNGNELTMLDTWVGIGNSMGVIVREKIITWSEGDGGQFVYVGDNLTGGSR